MREGERQKWEAKEEDRGKYTDAGDKEEKETETTKEREKRTTVTPLPNWEGEIRGWRLPFG